MTLNADEAVQALIAKLSADEPVDPDTIPPALRDHPEIARLMSLARVMSQLNANGAGRAAPPPARIGAYRLLRLLGSGGMGEVWLGERADGTVEHRVAIKRVRGQLGGFDSRLASERRILARLSHPNIARFIDAGVDDLGVPWLALDYVDGLPITDWCNDRKLGLRARLELFRKVCAAVEHAHRHLVVHRDIKPGNVLVDAEGEPRLLDFGIAKLLDGSESEATGALLTAAYAAPEQLRGTDISTATDVYALGLLLFRLLAGALPASRASGNAAVVLSQLDSEETQRPSKRAREAGTALPYPAEALEGDLDAIVAKALRAAPEARYGSVFELSEDIGNHLHSRPVAARVATRRYRLSRFVSRNRRLIAVVAGAVLALSALTGVALWQAKRAGEAAAQAAREAERADAEAIRSQAQARRAKRAFEFVLSVFLQADPMRRDARGAISLDEAFEDALKRIDTEFSDDPMVAADLNDDFGEILASKGRFDESRQRLNKALTLAEQAHGPDSPVVAETLLNLGVVEAYRGHKLAGRPYFERAITILEQYADTEPLNLGNAYFSLASLLVMEEAFERSGELALRGLALYRKHLPPDDIRLPIALYNVGSNLQISGRPEQAAAYLTDALAAIEKLQGKDSAGMLPLLDMLARNRDALGDTVGSRELSERGLAIARMHFKDPHPRHADALVETGYRWIREGEVDAGRKLWDEGIAIYMQLGSDSELRGRQLLLAGLTAVGQWQPLLTASDTMLERCESFDAALRTRCPVAQAYRAIALAMLGDRARALTEAEALLQSAAKSGASSEVAAMAWAAHGEALFADAQREAALVAMRKALQMHRERFGAEQFESKRIAARLAAMENAAP